MSILSDNQIDVINKARKAFNDKDYHKYLSTFSSSGINPLDSPRDCTAHGISYLKLGRLEKAKDFLKFSVALDPASSVAVFGIIEVLNKLGQYNGIALLTRFAINLDPKNVNSYLHSFSALFSANMLDECLNVAARARTELGSNVETLYHEAKIYHALGRLQDAEETCNIIIGISYNDIARLDLAYEAVANFAKPEKYEAIIQKNMTLAESINRKAMLLLNLYFLYKNLDRWKDALSAIKSAYQLLPDNITLHGFVVEAQRKAAKRVRAWPTRLLLKNQEEFAQHVRRHFFRDLTKQKILTSTSGVVTIGSCFAQNLANSLSARGFEAFNFGFGEELNSTFANRDFIDWVCSNDGGRNSAAFIHRFGEDAPSEFARRLRNANCIVMTLGVAPCWFNMKTGSFVLHLKETGGDNGDDAEKQEIFRTTTVSENVANIIYINERLRSLNPSINVFITVSPVPLAGTNEMSSAIAADCISKSVMRVAAHEVIETDPSIKYWPSFEIVRWLGAHSEFPTFGTDDNHSRHVARWIVDLIIDLFVEFYGSGDIP